MSQLDIFSIKKNSLESIIIPNGAYIYIPNYFDSELSKAYFKNFLDDIQWRQEEMKIYGRLIKFPRLTSWYGDSNKPYTFSGITLNPNEWTNHLLEIKNKIELQFELSFNSVLLNIYRNGSDSISWHTDAEKELGQNPVIASVNFRATRNFQLRHRDTKERIDINLENGSLLIMRGELQHYWQHQIPKTKKDIGQRINLTFRYIK